MAGPYMKDGGMNRDPKRGAKLAVWRRGPEETIRRERYERGREDRGNPMTFLPGPKPGSDRAISQHKYIAEGYTVPATDRCVDLSQRESKTGEAESPGLTTRAKRRMKQ